MCHYFSASAEKILLNVAQWKGLRVHQNYVNGSPKIILVWGKWIILDPKMTCTSGSALKKIPITTTKISSLMRNSGGIPSLKQNSQQKKKKKLKKIIKKLHLKLKKLLKKTLKSLKFFVCGKLSYVWAYSSIRHNMASPSKCPPVPQYTPQVFPQYDTAPRTWGTYFWKSSPPAKTPVRTLNDESGQELHEKFIKGSKRSPWKCY